MQQYDAMHNGRAGCSKFCERTSIVSPDGERARALREQAYFVVYLPTLLSSPPGGISKMINATVTRANSESRAATRRATSTRCRTPCMHFVNRVKFHPDSTRADVMLYIGIEDLEALWGKLETLFLSDDTICQLASKFQFLRLLCYNTDPDKMDSCTL